jgi:hypothetical protein
MGCCGSKRALVSSPPIQSPMRPVAAPLPALPASAPRAPIPAASPAPMTPPAAARSAPATLPAGARPAPRNASAAAVRFEYVGATAMTVMGPATGALYRFERTGSTLSVDPRDAPALGLVPRLRPASSR